MSTYAGLPEFRALVGDLTRNARKRILGEILGGPCTSIYYIGLQVFWSVEHTY